MPELSGAPNLRPHEVCLCQTRSEMSKSRAAVGSQNFGGVGSPSGLIGFGLDESGAHQVLDAAERLGISIVDTAFSYAAGASQQMIGSWLAADPDRIDAMTIVDKVGVIERDGGLRLDLSYDSILSQAAIGRDRLGVAAVDVVVAHAPDPETSAEETLEGFGALIGEGFAGSWGVSNIDGPTLIEWLETAYRLGLPAPRFVENEYNLVRREAEEAVLPLCREEGIGFLAYSPSGSGLLTGKYRRGETPSEGSLMALRPEMIEDIDDRVEGLIAAITEVAVEHDVSNVTVALAWLLAQPGVIPIAGTRKPHHMEAIEHALQLELTNDGLNRLSSY